jgi:hypothetical protein
MDVEQAGEVPLSCLIQRHGALELLRADGFWRCDLFYVWPGEYFIPKDNTGTPFEPPGMDAHYYRVPEKVAERLLAPPFPPRLPGEDAHGRMASTVAALEEAERRA